jgi:uncharacterized protein with HEPN domain
VKKDPKVFINHILESIQLIEEYSQNISATEFHSNRVVQDAIIRRLEIIGEAVKNLPAIFKHNHPEIPWKQMAGIRDILIHEYFDIDLSLTWAVVYRELPVVKQKLQEILDLYNISDATT